MSAMDIDNDLAAVLASLRDEVDNSDIAQALYQLEDFYERKLWNQLALAVEELYSIPESANGGLRERIFTQFLAKFHAKLNPIKMVDFLLQSFDAPGVCVAKLAELETEIVAELAKKLTSRRIEDSSAIDGEEPVVYVRLQIARYALLEGDSGRAEAILDAVSDKFDSTLQNEYSSKINAAYYLTKCQHYKLQQQYNGFYTSGLLYLSSAGAMSRDQQVAFCHDLCVAALLGDKIYNFGELILHDILASIGTEDSPYFWLYRLVHTLNAGDLHSFTSWLDQACAKSPQLAHRRSFLHEKIVIMALLELVSSKSASDKKIAFAEVCEVTGTALNDVEFLVIKCFSLGLIKGYINQIDQVLVVTWLQPRVLNLDQVKTLYTHLVSWETRVEQLAKDVHVEGGQVWASA